MTDSDNVVSLFGDQLLEREYPTPASLFSCRNSRFPLTQSFCPTQFTQFMEFDGLPSTHRRASSAFPVQDIIDVILTILKEQESRGVP